MAISKDMTIQQIVGEHPEAVRVFFQHGLMCVGCAAARFESLDQGAKAHGIDADVLVADLNAFVQAQTTQASA
jgi:hybrid cluster-associated redox disulfide protein